ncbi:LacI family transcriptional regulator [Mucilaginibacter sp. PPCGB 2223]|uniref:LacI family DNA-binding transcriptional regulator n=1 Tax=Mucilaginibacter sp. PPCGB 2223 TaxID=1886027 RepID=UPI00082563B4|nr:LacI family DNA-binding transcriptional regulator [Mucilaginibacter sp. PPCGB 2223]OCX54642.1 LacI family transcriptional regulator [Mucilaginibacter sp. PPCGB 2223]
MHKPAKEITIYDIAAKLNLSAATVSRSLNDMPGVNAKTKKKIVETARAMGYSSNAFASNLRTKRSNTIGVIVPRLNSTFMSDVIAGMEKIANEANYNLIISQSLETMKKEISNSKTMYNNRVDGLLISLAYDTDNIDHLENFLSRNIPVIFFDRIYEHRTCPNIHIDNFKAAYDITRHLIDQGCKRIAHIGATGLRNVYAERYNGYKKALLDSGLPADDDLLIINDLSAKAGQEAGEHILKMQPMPDAVFAANDICAINCMLVLKRAGIKIPEQVAFAGFNNDPAACIIEPNLTTVNYKGYEMGEVAAKILIDHLTQNDNLRLTHSLILRHELLVRGSSVRG